MPFDERTDRLGTAVRLLRGLPHVKFGVPAESIFAPQRCAVLLEVAQPLPRSYLASLARRDPYVGILAQDTRLAGVDSLFLVLTGIVARTRDILDCIGEAPRGQRAIVVRGGITLPGESLQDFTAVQLSALLP